MSVDTTATAIPAGPAKPAATTPGRAPAKTVTQAGEVRSSRIESLRALAALAVLESHTFGLPRAFGPATNPLQHIESSAYLAVYVFFALTGYLLFKPFATRIVAGGPGVDYRRYAINRVVRILPLYYVVLIVLLLAQERGGNFSQWWHFMLFAQNFSTSTVQTVDGPMWSLVIEVHFYVLLPLLALGIGRLARGSSRRAIAVLLTLAVASILVHHYGDGYRPPGNVPWNSSLPATFFFFVPGMVLAILGAEAGKRTLTTRVPQFARAELWLLAAIPLWTYAIFLSTLTGEVCVAVGAFFVLGACVLPLHGGWILGALDWKPIAALGVCSYSLYLWHVPLVRWLMHRDLAWFGHVPPAGLFFLQAAALCVPVALLSYALVESPFLRLRKRWFGSARVAG
jgi:peptidoglycan/LPS O-acetylase OafA/YrhL